MRADGYFRRPKILGSDMDFDTAHRDHCVCAGTTVRPTPLLLASVSISSRRVRSGQSCQGTLLVIRNTDRAANNYRLYRD